MKRIAIAAVATVLLVGGTSAFAQASGAMSSDSMSKDAMSKDSMAKGSMSKDSMGKDAMAKDSMSKDGSTMKPDAMKKDDAMSQQCLADPVDGQQGEIRGVRIVGLLYLRSGAGNLVGCH